MATGVKLPTKRDHAFASDSGDDAAASKKAKVVAMEEEDEESSGDESMSERSASASASVSDDEIMSDRDRDSESDDEIMSDIDGDGESYDEFPDFLRQKENEDIVREFQIFFGSKGKSDRANQVSSYKDARKLFTKAEMTEFQRIYWDKWWHIRTNPDGVNSTTKLTDYQRLALHPPNDRSHYFHDFQRYYFTYEFDSAYPKFADELSQNIQWGTTLDDAQPIAEQIWKKHIPFDVDVPLNLLYTSAEQAIAESNLTQSKKESTLLFVDIYKRELDGEDYMQALKEIIKENGLSYCPQYKDFIIKETLEHDGLIWRRYHAMKRFCKFQEGEALEDNILKDRITSFFEVYLQGSYGYAYTRYANEKIRIAKDLRIL